MKTNEITETALLAAFIAVTGAIKLPGIMPGAEFQLSAPIAVAISAVFGFKKYILAGIISSVVGLLIGTQNPLNVAIAMEFRLVSGLVLALGRRKSGASPQGDSLRVAAASADTSTSVCVGGRESGASCARARTSTSMCVGRNTLPALVLAGPVGTLVARLSLFFVIGDAALGAVLYAVPGMIFTAIAAPVMTKTLALVKAAVSRS